MLGALANQIKGK